MRHSLRFSRGTAMSTRSSPNESTVAATAREQHVARGVTTAHPVVVARAQGARIWDVDGREYLDFVGGIGALNVGHSHPRVVAAATAQLQRLTHAAFQVAEYEPYLDLCARL